MERARSTAGHPVILLIFANDLRAGASGYLRKLDRERRLIDAVLAPLDRQGRCRVVTETNATLDRVFAKLVQYGDRIVGVHFGGHADPEGLHLDDGDGQPKPAHMRGIAAQLATLPELRWVFLNGCGTAVHVDGLHRGARVPVIATERAIRDNIAAGFAHRFYHALANGGSIAAAFSAARAEAQAVGDLEDLLRAGEATRMLRPGTPAGAPGWPWVLLLPEHEPEAGEWRLVRDPEVTEDGYRPSFSPLDPPVEHGPLDGPQRAALLERWLGEAAAAVQARLADAPVADAIDDPILLWLLVLWMRAHPGRPLPVTLSALCEAAITLLLEPGHRSARRGVGPLPAGARRLLARLAATLDGGDAWTRAELQDALGRALSEDDDLQTRLRQDEQAVGGFLDAIVRDVGLLIPAEGAGDRWRFLHRSLRARLMAEDIAHRGPDAIAVLLQQVAYDPVTLERWSAALGMACALLDDPTAPLRLAAIVDPSLPGQVLPHLTGVSPRTALAMLFALDPAGGLRWHGETVARLVARAPIADVVDLLLERVTPALDLDRLAFVHFAIEQLGAEVPRARFFAAAGRPIERCPRLEVSTIPAGGFEMGDDERLAAVRISRPFDLARTPVTLGQYRAFDPTHDARGDVEHPATGVSWWRARLCAAWFGGRLPTEAEWEYACRAGTRTRFWSGDTPTDLDRIAWYDANSGQDAHPVGRLPANPWGLFDMHGNVWEWCQCGWGDPLPPGEAPIVDPFRRPSGDGRVLRGGAFDSAADGCRAALRSWQTPTRRMTTVGFRIVRDPDGA